MSRITVGLSEASDRFMLSWGGSPSADTPPFHDITIGAAGENPSATFQPVGSTVTPAKFVGSVPCGIASRRPVWVVGSSTSNTAEGHGVMQALSPRGLHSAFIGKLVSPLHAATTRT